MRLRVPALRPRCEWRRAVFFFLASFSFFALATPSQDSVVDAARQERARQAAAAKSPRHVYTEEDLKRPTILTPEDQARVEARKGEQNSAPAEQNAQHTPPDPNSQSPSLGEIARRYRQEKAAREARLVAKEKFSPFPYDIPQPSFAVPAPEIAPLPGNFSGSDANTAPSHNIRPPLPHFLPPVVSRRRVSPFEPRPLRLRGTSSVPPAILGMPPPLPSTYVVRPAAKNPAVDSKPMGTPDRSALMTIEVQKGQSWWKLAALYLGNGARWRELWGLNAVAGSSPQLLKLGSVVAVPNTGLRTPSTSPTKFVKVRKGDSLWLLAQQHLGRGAGWICLASLNPQVVDYTRLSVGAALRLPDRASLQSCPATTSNFSKN